MEWTTVLLVGGLLLLGMAAGEEGGNGVAPQGPKFVVEGDRIKMSCDLDQFKRLKWSKDGNEILNTDPRIITIPYSNGTRITMMVIHHAKVEDSGVYKCNPSSGELVVHVLNEFTLTAKEKIVLMPKSSLFLQCNSSINFQAMTWTFNGEVITPTNKDGYKLDPEKGSLLVDSADSKHAGNYTCSINSTEVEGESNLSRTIQVVQEPFAYFKSKGSLNMVEGEDLTISCNVLGHPRPIVTWEREGVPLTQGGRIQFKDYDNRTELIIDDVTMDDRANYTCIVANDQGNHNVTVYVRIKSKLAALWPFLGICAEVAVLCVVIFIYEKRRNKTELEESDTDQSPEQKKPADRKEQDVRHRK